MSEMLEYSPRKKKRGDRKDAYIIKDTDSMHLFMPYLLPNRADNEAVANVEIDLTNVNKFIIEKNAENPEYKYTFFQILTAAIAKTLAHRPKMNRFYSGHRYYERKHISLAFVCKKQLSDDGDETLINVELDRTSEHSPLQQFHDAITKNVASFRGESRKDGAGDIMDTLTKLPRWLLRIVTRVLFFLHYHGMLPDDFVNVDPYHTTAFISNLGSVKMSASYHHLTNWGTNSVFVCIGEKQWKPFFQKDGSYEMRETVELGLTIDERIADGIYFAGTINFLKNLLENPELLERPTLEVPKNAK